IFNNAAQVWNHTFYWHSMTPKAKQITEGDLAKAIDATFGSLQKFKDEFTQAGLTQFGSGWAWLVKNKNGGLEILKTPNANNPMTDHKKPLLTCDVWEHAYYIDTRNDRAKYINHFWSVVNWDFAESNFKA
ncbi:MAG: superoxide dismutase, partial [Bdellovibrionales bacterium]